MLKICIFSHKYYSVNSISIKYIFSGNFWNIIFRKMTSQISGLNKSSGFSIFVFFNSKFIRINISKCFKNNFRKKFVYLKNHGLVMPLYSLARFIFLYLDITKEVFSTVDWIPTSSPIKFTIKCRVFSIKNGAF